MADEIVVIDSALREGVEPEERQERVLSDGSRHEVYKRYFDPETLARSWEGQNALGGYLVRRSEAYDASARWY